MQDLLTLAQTPGPMQSMALAALQELMGDRGMLEMVGRSPSAGQNGLNFGDPSPGHASYPSELMDALVARYGTEISAPSGDRGYESPIHPAEAAQKAWRSEMDHYGPSLMDRIKALGGALYDDPGLTSDLMGYMTPVAGNIKGSQDFTQDSEAMGDAMAPLSRSSDHGDALGVLMQYLPSLGGDVLQMLSPIGMGRPKMPRSMASGGSVDILPEDWY